MIDEMAKSDLDLVVAGTARRRDDGGVGGQGAAREADARGRHVRPPRLPAGDPGDHQAGREGRQGAVGLPAARRAASTRTRSRRWSRPTCATPSPRTEKQKRHDLVDAAKAKVKDGSMPADATPTEKVLLGDAFKELEERHRARRHHQDRTRIDGRDLKTVRPIVSEVHVLPRTHGSALFTRGETQAHRRRHARHRRGRAVRRRAGRHAQRALHAALQLPALLGRRDGPHGLARPPRDRPRQARLARRASADAGAGGVPLHGPPRLGDHRVQRLVVDGDRVRQLAGADGCRRAAEARRWPASPWA